MEEILPGVRHWTAFLDAIKARVSSYYVEPAGILIDPMLPEDGFQALEQLPVRPAQIVLTSQRHRRDSSRIAEHFDVPIRVAMPGMDAFADEPRARPFEFSDEVATGVVALKVGKMAPDESTLHITHDRGAIMFGDSLRRYGGALSFPPDDLLGDDPQAVQEGLKDKFRGLLARDFEALLFAHGDPMTSHGKARLRDFVERPVGYPDYGRIV